MINHLYVKNAVLFFSINTIQLQQVYDALIVTLKLMGYKVEENWIDSSYYIEIYQEDNNALDIEFHYGYENGKLVEKVMFYPFVQAELGRALYRIFKTSKSLDDEESIIKAFNCIMEMS